VENLIFNAGFSSVKDPSKYGLPISQKGKKITEIVNNKLPLTLWGVETEYKTRFWYANNFLKGAVLNINYTHIFSEVKAILIKDRRITSFIAYLLYIETIII